MRTRTFGAVAVVAWLLAATLAARQTTPATSGVSGVVVDESGQSVSTVMVVVFPVDEQKWATGRDSKAIQWTAPDSGHFKITGLPPGEYKLAITQEAIGESGPDAALIKTLVPRGFPMTLAPGEQAQVQLILNAEMKILRAARSGAPVRVVAGAGSSATLPAGPGGRVSGPPGPPPGPQGPAAISGKVIDAEGKPVAGAHIQRFMPIVRNGVTQFAQTGQPAITDQDGVYHLTGLAPGDFLVAALARSIDVSAPGAPDVSHMPASTVGTDGRKLGYVTTYYPGADTSARATRVTVSASEVTGINFSLQRQPMIDVSGTFTGAAATLFDAAVLLPAAQADGTLGTEARRAAVAPDGRFLFSDVPFGTYALNFTSATGWAQETITVTPTTEPFTIGLHEPLKIKGRVEFVGEMPPPTGDTLKPFRIRLTPAVLTTGSRTFEVPIQPSGEFTVSGVSAGRYLLQSRANPPWTEMSGRLGAVDTLDAPVEITANRDDAVVVLVDREAGVSGTVKEVGDVAHDALVIVFSAESQYWTSGTRRVRVSRIVAGSGFSVSGLPPGQYLAFALPLGPDTPPANNALLQRYQSRALRFELIPREHKTIELQMIK